jgi:cytochrome c oxidase subunit 2
VKRLIVIAIVALMQMGAAEPRLVEIHAKRFDFTPNVVHLKKGETVTIRLMSTDAAHGLLIDALNVDLDAAADRPDSVTITPAETGTFHAICDHFCGSGHGGMQMTVIVE